MTKRHLANKTPFPGKWYEKEMAAPNLLQKMSIKEE